MPLARYFVFVGGVLLALLFVVGAVVPQPPIEVRADSDLPVIRIQSDRKWPDRVVFDTNRPTIPEAPVPNMPIAKTVASVTVASVPAPVTVPGAPAKARVLDAFAQLQPSEARQVQPTDAKKPAPKLPPKRKVAKRHAAPPVVVVAQQPQFGFFGSSTW